MLWACVLVLVRRRRFARRTSRSDRARALPRLERLGGGVAHVVDRAAADGTGGGEESGLRGSLGILVLLVRGRARATAVIVAVAVAISAVLIVALGGYLLQPGAADPTQGRLLFEPLGYANALGGLAAIGLPLLVAAAAGGVSPFGSVLAAAATVPVATALYLSQSRSAWLAFACALGFWASADSAEAARSVSSCRRRCFLRRPSRRLRGSGLSALRCRTSPAIVVASLPARSCSLARAPPRCSVRGAIRRAADRGHSLAGCRARHRLRAWTGRARRRRARWRG